jgi:RNA polymerase sigma-70 factor (ECF subfamily)
MDLQMQPAPVPAPWPGDDPLQSAIVRICAGDESALSLLYDATSSRVFGLALRILKDRPAAEEATLDVYTQVWRQSERFDPSKGTVLAWLMTLARSRAIDHRRGRSRREGVEQQLDERTAFEDGSASPEHASIDSERGRFVRRALASLPGEQRRALEAAFFEGLSHTEVAERFGLPLGTIKTRIRAGLKALRTLIADSGESLA